MVITFNEHFAVISLPLFVGQIQLFDMFLVLADYHASKRSRYVN